MEGSEESEHGFTGMWLYPFCSLCYVSVADLEEESGNPYLSKISQEKDYCEVGRVDFMFLGLADF